jgi:hypothetical protein
LPNFAVSRCLLIPSATKQSAMEQIIVVDV